MTKPKHELPHGLPGWRRGISATANGVWELRIDLGPGYRLYYAMVGKACVLLLCGGDKRKQSADIAKAIEYLNDYKRRSKV